MDHSLIRRHQGQSMDSRCRDDCAVGRIFERTPNSRNFNGDFQAKGEHLDSGIRVDLGQEVSRRHLHARPSVTQEDSDFQKSNGANGDRLVAIHRLFQGPLLFA